jgi:hypothetical protein
MLTKILIASVLVGGIPQAMILLAELPNNPETVAIGFLSGTGLTGFMLWWLTSRVTKKQDEHTTAILQMGEKIVTEAAKTAVEISRLREKLRSDMGHLTEMVAEVVLLHEFATESAKKRAEQLKEEIQRGEGS